MMNYVNREKLRDALYEADAITMKGIKIINQFPSIEIPSTDKIKGKWIKSKFPITFPDTIIPTHRCSICNEWNYNGIDNYCSNCGAEMDG